MKNKTIYNIAAAAFLMLILSLFIAPDIAEARRGRSFGGSRRSRSYSRPRNRSFSRQSPAARSRANIQRQKTTPSFGGKRITRAEAQKKYGVPRRTSSYTGKNEYGQSQKYILNHYSGGYTGTLMQNYMAHRIPYYMMWMPWTGAFWYTRPQYVPMPDGTIQVYPPTFNYSKVLFAVVLTFVLIFYLYRKIKGPRRMASNDTSTSSFG